MATVITVMNMKGGVGKTTLCAHLAGMLALYENAGRCRRVLAIDYDPQFNLSQMYLRPATYFDLENKRKTSLAILKDDETDVDPFAIPVPGNRKPPLPGELAHLVYKEAHGGRLELIPSTLDLMYVALGQTERRTSAFEERFTKFIQKCREEYDVILIDCHPAGSVLTKTSLMNSDHVLVPVSPSQFARRGVDLMRRFIDSAKQTLPYHIVFNHPHERVSNEEELAIRGDPRYAQRCLIQALRYFKAFWLPRDGRNFVWHSKRSYSTIALENLDQVVTEITGRLDL